jgi:hypothetical protein
MILKIYFYLNKFYGKSNQISNRMLLIITTTTSTAGPVQSTRSTAGSITTSTAVTHPTLDSGAANMIKPNLHFSLIFDLLLLSLLLH